MEGWSIIYGLSQNPDTNDYILVQKHFTWISENEEIDDLEMQLKISNNNNSIFEWIPYNQFNEIKKTGEGNFATAYSAIWKDGPLYLENQKIQIQMIIFWFKTILLG